jgi:hypothetical protein
MPLLIRHILVGQNHAELLELVGHLPHLADDVVEGLT